MKTSELIEALENIESTYGDLQVVMRFAAGQGDIRVDESIHFSHDQYTDKPDEIAIQNFIY